MGTPGGASNILMPGSLPEMEISSVWDVAWALEIFKDPQVMLMCGQAGKKNRSALQTSLPATPELPPRGLTSVRTHCHSPLLPLSPGKPVTGPFCMDDYDNNDEGTRITQDASLPEDF